MRDLQPRARGPLGMSPLKRLKRSSLPPRQKADRRTAESPSSSCLTSSSSSCHLDPSSPSSSAGSCNAPEFDEEIHSRQLAVYGWEAMRRISASNVLISGLNGLGAEIAKNIVLAGVKSVTLHDEGSVGFSDLSSNFLLWDEDVGRNRALACAEKLQELNNLVEISTMTVELRKANLSSFQAAVFTDISFAKAIEYNDYCHNWQHPIFFIKAEVRGLFGSVFCDFGPKFSVVDVDGEEPHTGTVVSISKDEPALVECVDDERLEFQDGDSVIFSDVEGMTELNDGKPRKVKNAGPHSFSIEEDTYWFCDYKTGGKVTQVKEPKVLRFKPLKDALRDPGDFLCSDFSKAERSALLHLAFQALDAFRNACRCFPVAGCEKDAKTLIDMAVQFNESMGCNKLKEIDETLVCHFASGSGSVLNPMAAMFGGIAGGEVLKACSGKFHPLFQFFYFDSVESLPTEPLDANDLKPLGCRYDAQISVFGSKLQKKLEAAQVFLLGSGGLGCELLKNLALMGVCCSPNGKLTVTDYNVVKKSNLGHQFLFREWDVGAFKSFVAACAASSINPNLHIKSLKHRVGEETLDVLDDEFWESLDVVVNALDNVQSRIFTDFGKLKAAKVVAGWVVPAIATSTALAAGLVCLELYKVLAGGHNVEDYCNTFALPLFSMKKLVLQFRTVGLC